MLTHTLPWKSSSSTAMVPVSSSSPVPVLQGELMEVKAASMASQRGLRWWMDWDDRPAPLMNWDRAVREGVRQNAVVHACLRYLENAFAEPSIEVIDKEGNPIPDSPIYDLFNQPNPFMDWAFLAKVAIAYQAIGGNVYLWIERNNQGVPIGLWPMHDGQCTPIKGHTTDRERAMIDHYEYWVNGTGEYGEVYIIPSRDIIQFQWSIDPGTPIKGLSALMPIARAIDTINELNRYIWAVLKNDATPKTIITYKDVLTDEAITRFKREFMENFGGMNRGSLGMLSEMDGITITRLSTNLNELAASAIRNAAEADICMGFGINAALIGASVAVDANVQGAQREVRENFTEMTLAPLWSMYESAFNHQLLSHNFADDYQAGVRVRFTIERVRALAEDADARVERFRKAWISGAIPRKYYLDALGIKSLGAKTDEEDVYFYQVMFPNKTGAIAPTEQPPALPPALPASTKSIKADRADTIDTTYDNAPFLAADKKRAEIEGRFTTAMHETLTTQGQEVTRLAVAAYQAADTTKADAYSFPLDWEDDPAMIDIFAAYVDEAAELGIDTAEACFSGLAETFADDLTRIRAESGKWAGKYAGISIKGLDKTTRQGVRDALKAAIEAQDGVDVLTERLAQFFDENRARLIAVTETTKAYARGSVRTYKAMGVTRFIFRTAGDENVDSLCADKNGRDYSAARATALLPLHPGCRCDLEAVPPKA